MANWHTTQYAESAWALAAAGECSARTTSQSGANGATMGEGGGVTTFSSRAVNSNGDGVAGTTRREGGNNYFSTTQNATTSSNAAVDYGDSDDTPSPNTVNAGVNANNEYVSYNNVLEAGSTAVTEGGSPAVVGTNSNKGTFSKYVHSIKHYLRLGVPAKNSRHTNANSGKSVGGTTYSPANGNGGSTAGRTTSGGNYNSFGGTTGGRPALNSTYATYFKSNTGFSDGGDTMQLSLSSYSYSRGIFATRQIEQEGKNSTMAAQWDYTAAYGDYTFVYFEDSDTYYGTKVARITYEPDNYDYGQPASVENPYEGDAVPTEEKIELQDSNGENSDLSPDEETGDVDVPDAEAPDEDSPDWVAQIGSQIAPVSNVSYTLTNYTNVGFSYDTKTARGAYSFSPDATYKSTVVDYGDGDGYGDDYNYCGNINVTLEKYDMYESDSSDTDETRSGNYYNTYGLSIVYSTTYYALGGQVGVKGREEVGGDAGWGTIDGSALSYGTSASVGPSKYDRLVMFAGAAEGNSNATRMVLDGQGYRTRLKPKLTKTITYWTTSYNSESRSSIGYFGLGNSVRINDIFTSSYETQVYNGTENQDNQYNSYKEEVYQRSHGDRLEASRAASTRDSYEYNYDYVFWGGEGMVTITKTQLDYSNYRTISTVQTRASLEDGYGVTEKQTGSFGFKGVYAVGGEYIEFYSQSAISPRQVNVFKTNTNLDQGEDALTPPELKFTEEYLKSDISEGETIWTSISTRTDSFWSIPGFSPSISKAKFHPILDTVSIPGSYGSVTVEGDKITQLRTVQLTVPRTYKVVDDSEQPPATDTFTEVFSFTQTLGRTISKAGGLQYSNTGYAIAEPVVLSPGQFLLTGQLYLGGGMGYDVPGTANVGPGHGSLMNADGTTDLGYDGLNRTIQLDTGPMLYKNPEGARYSLGGDGVEYFSRGVDPYQDYYEC